MRRQLTIADTRAVNANTGKRFRQFSIGWKTRHLVSLLIAVLGVFAFLVSRIEWSDMHRWNRAVGDMSVVMVAFSMAIGPLSRLLPSTRPAIPWRREFGIYGVILAIIHTAIILVGWVQWDLMRLFGYEMHPSGVYVMVQHGFALANIIGIVALVYGIVLALSSSNWSQRLLGGAVWKYLQQSAYVLWALIVVHTAYFLYLHFQDFHRNTPDPNWAQIPFVVLVVLVIALQFAASFKTWRLKRRRAGSDQFEMPQGV